MNIQKRISLVILFALFYLISGTEQRTRTELAQKNVPSCPQLQWLTGTPLFWSTLYKFSSKLVSILNEANNKNGELDNIILSPITIYASLSMMLLGTQENSTTKRELLHTLGYSSLSEPELRQCHEDYVRVLTFFAEGEERPARMSDATYMSRKAAMKSRLPLFDMVNMVITHNKADILPEYKENVKKYYNSSLDDALTAGYQLEIKTEFIFQTKSQSESARHDHITQLDEVIEATLMSALRVQSTWGGSSENTSIERVQLRLSAHTKLLSAIRMQDFWRQEFKETRGIFYEHGFKNRPVNRIKLSQKELTSVRYMELSNVRRHVRVSHESCVQETFRQLCDLNVRIVEVPLKLDAAYTIYEPLGYSTPGDNKLQKLIEQLSESFNGTQETKFVKVNQLLKYFQVPRMHLTMPKVKFETGLDISEALKSMGLKRAFERDVSQIDHVIHDKLFIDKVKHEAMIDINGEDIRAGRVNKVKATAKREEEGEQYSSETNTIRVSIEKPFMFFINQNTMPLFVGQLNSLSDSE